MWYLRYNSTKINLKEYWLCATIARASFKHLISRSSLCVWPGTSCLSEEECLLAQVMILARSLGTF